MKKVIKDFKRTLSVLLAVAMVVTMMPQTSITSSAAEVPDSSQVETVVETEPGTTEDSTNDLDVIDSTGVSMEDAGVAKAASIVAPIKTIGAQQEKANGKMGNVSSVTIYTNGSFKPIKISYTWDKNTDGTVAPAGVSVSTSNRGVVRVNSSLSKITHSEPAGKKNTVTTTGELELIPVANGKAVITVKDLVNSKKTKKINVVVKTYADNITFQNVEKIDGKDTITVAKGGAVNLGAAITNAASDTKIRYSVKDVDPKGNVSVDAKGNVKVKTKDIVSATVVVASNDKNISKEITVQSAEPKVSTIAFAQDTTATKDTLGMLNKKNVVALKGNPASSAYTYQLICSLNSGAAVGDLIFTSNKPAVAAVDENGKITAMGNGTAVITATPKLGNKKSAKVTVKVTTDVELVTVAAPSFSILANGKDIAKISAATNTNASKKTVKYELMSLKDSQTNNKVDISQKKEVGKYITLDAKGNVKTKKPCEAVIRAYATDNTSIDRTVTVTGTVPVSSITLASQAGQPEVAKNKVTVYRIASNEHQPLKLVPTLKSSIPDTEPGNTKVTWKSSKPAVADVDEDGTIKVYSNGSAKITATAADGSKKAASVTVTVKTDAYEIILPKAQIEDGKTVIYVEGADKEKNFTLSSIIKAATNKDASNKAVEYREEDTSVKAVKLSAGQEKTLIVSAKDTRQHGNNSAEKTPVTKEFTLKCVDKDSIAKSYTMDMDNKDIELKAGEKQTLTASVRPEEGKYSTDLSTIKWKSSATNVAAITNGEITAKAPGTATITAYYEYKNAENKKVKAEKTVQVYVGRKEADVQKEINNSFTATLNAENRDYTGVSTKFDAKKNIFTLDIKEPGKDFTQMQDTGFTAAIKGIVNSNPLLSFEELNMTDTHTGDVWSAQRAGAQVKVLHNDMEQTTVSTADEAVSYVLQNIVGEDKLLKDWNGKDYQMDLRVTDTRQFTANGSIDSKKYHYSYSYAVNTGMAAGLYKGMLDKAIQDNVTALKIDGIDSINYRASENAVEVLVGDAQQKIEDADKQARTAVVDALRAVFEDAQSVQLTVETVLGKDVITKEKTDQNSTDEFIDSLLDEYISKVTSQTDTFGELDGSVAVADVVFKVGDIEYNHTFKLNFNVGEKAFDSAADKAIQEAVEGKTFAFGTVAYDAGSNKLSVRFNSEYAGKAPAELKGTGISAVLEAMVKGTNVQNAVVIINGKSTAINAEDDPDAILAVLAEGIEKLGELDGTDAALRVTYASANGSSQKTLLYTIAFSLAEGVTFEAVTETETEETTEEETTEELTEETTEETTEEESTEETTEVTTEEESTEETTEETTEEESTEETTEVTTEEESTEESTEVTTEEPAEETSAEQEQTAEEMTEESTTEPAEATAE